MTKAEYIEYLSSDEWKELRNDALEWASYRCAICYKPQPPHSLHVHHRTYDRVGNEDLSDLTVLCVDCHILFHDVIEGVESHSPIRGAV